MAQMLAGAGQRCITPSEEWMKKNIEENGPREGFDGVYEDIYVGAIAVSDGEKKIIIMSADIGVFPGMNKLARRMTEELGVDPMGLIIGETHNHEAPNAQFLEGGDYDVMGGRMPVTPSRNEYAEFIHEQAMAAAKEALDNMVPARMGVNKGMSYINCCRELPTPVGGIQANDWHAPNDHELLVIQFERLDNHEIIGIFINHANHSNMACWNLYNGDFKKIQGDVGGGVSRFVERAYKKQFPVLWCIGGGGDQNPFVRSILRSVDYDEDGNFRLITSYFTPETVIKQLQYMTCIQGMEVLELSKNMTEYTEEFSFVCADMSVDAKARMPYRDLKLNPLCGERPEPQPWRQETFTHYLRLAVLNGVAFAMMSAEIYADTALDIKQVIPAEHTAILSMSYGMLSYIPSHSREWVNGFGTIQTVAADSEETDRVYHDGFTKLAQEVGL